MYDPDMHLPGVRRAPETCGCAGRRSVILGTGAGCYDSREEGVYWTLVQYPAWPLFHSRTPWDTHPTPETLIPLSAGAGSHGRSIDSGIERDHRAWRSPIDAARNGWGCPPFADVIGRIEGRVDPPAPWVFGPIRREWQLEVERLPIRVQDQVKAQFLRGDLCGERQAVRPGAPVGLAKPHAVPGPARPPEQLVQAQARKPSQNFAPISTSRNGPIFLH